MRVTLWGTRGSVPSPGPETLRYGGNTPCVEIRGDDGALLVLDAGTGIRPLGATLGPDITRVDILLTHLHLDHILGLGFLGPLERPDLEVHIWGPPSTTLDLRARLTRYLSPPLFPVNLSDLPCRPRIHNVPAGPFTIAGFAISAAFVCHRGPTVGYRITDRHATMAYLPDHEPALGARRFPPEADWISGFDLAAGADLLIHDAQYSAHEYPEHVGWGHSALSHAIVFASAAGVKQLVAFHHDPGRSDDALDRLIADALDPLTLPFRFSAGREGMHFRLGPAEPPRRED